jgi:hypothetical protein
MRSAHCSAERHVHVDQLQLSPLPGAAVDGFDPEWLPAGSGGRVEISGSLDATAIFECLRLAAEARRLAAASHHPAQKADLLDVAQRWLALAGIHEGELEDDQLKNVAGR